MTRWDSSMRGVRGDYTIRNERDMALEDVARLRSELRRLRPLAKAVKDNIASIGERTLGRPLSASEVDFVFPHTVKALARIAKDS